MSRCFGERRCLIINNTSTQESSLNKTTLAALSYIVGPFAVLILIFEKNVFVRFHAIQSAIFSTMAIVINMILASFPIPLVGGFILIIEFVGWLILIYKAWQGMEWELPLIGRLTRKLLVAR